MSSSEVRVGQVYKLVGPNQNDMAAKDENFKVISILPNGHCVLWNVTNNRPANSNYAPRYLQDRRKWRLILAECPNCNQDKEIPDGDFLCKECRESMSENIVGRVIATVDDRADIVSFAAENKSVEFRVAGITFRLDRADAPEPLIQALKSFVR